MKNVKKVKFVKNKIKFKRKACNRKCNECLSVLC
jgi:hypothetical protein